MKNKFGALALWLVTVGWTHGIVAGGVAVLQDDAIERGTLRVDTIGRRPPFPERKISETFLDFAAPVLGDVPEQATEGQLNRALRVAFVAWNAVVYADVINERRFLDELRAATCGHPGPAALTELLIVRKRELFADDHRVIGQWKVSLRDGEVHLRAEARDPYPVKPSAE